MSHLDPITGKVDNWVIDEPLLRSNTQIFDSKGDLWLSLLPGGALGKWDRATDSIVYWEVPVMRSRPYGIIVDHKDTIPWLPMTPLHRYAGSAWIPRA